MIKFSENKLKINLKDNYKKCYDLKDMKECNFVAEALVLDFV